MRKVPRNSVIACSMQVFLYLQGENAFSGTKLYSQDVTLRNVLITPHRMIILTS